MTETDIEQSLEPVSTHDPEAFTILAAHTTRAHGVSGQVKVRLIGDNFAVIANLVGKKEALRAVSPTSGTARYLTLGSFRKQSQPKGAWIARFKEISDRDQSETIQGWSLYVKEGDRPILPEGEHYIDQLVGLNVKSDTGRNFGTLSEILAGPANDVYVTDEDVLIPVVSEYVLKIDLEAKEIIVKDVPGLRDDDIAN